MRYEMRFAGVGGQGAILAGAIIAEAAVMYMGLQSVQSPKYTSQVRGGATKVDVIISDTPVLFPNTTEINFMLAIHQAAYNRYAENLGKDCIILADSGLVSKVDTTKKVYMIPFNKLAKEKFGKTLFSNIISVGSICALLEGRITEEALRKSVADSVPAKFIDENMKAFDIGIDAVKNYKG